MRGDTKIVDTLKAHMTQSGFASITKQMKQMSLTARVPSFFLPGALRGWLFQPLWSSNAMTPNLLHAGCFSQQRFQRAFVLQLAVVALGLILKFTIVGASSRPPLHS